MSELYDFDLCFLSIFFPDDNEDYRKKSIQLRGQNITVIQKAIIDGLSVYLKEAPWIINTPLLTNYPHGYKDPFVRGSELAPRYHGVNHGFVNFSPFYSSTLFWGARHHIKQWAECQTGKEKVVIAYSLTAYTLQAMKYIKTLDKKIKTCIIVPDLPQYTYGETKSWFRRMKNSLGKFRAESSIKLKCEYVDYWLLFSEKMKEKIPAKINYMVFEGIYTDIALVESQEKHKNVAKKTVLYAGGLNQQYGVGLLLEAFAKLQGEEWNLLIAGSGPMKNAVVESVRYDERISYLGIIPHSDLLRIEQEADVLVNPRVNSGIFTRYSFPSKNMEYLSTGTPMVGFKLEGIPDEYDKFINYFPEDSASSLADTISSVCTLRTAAKEKAEEGRLYVKNHKNKYAWGNKILEFLSDV